MSGKDADTLKKKVMLLEKYFGTSSKTKIENMKSSELRACYLALKAHFEPDANVGSENLSAEEAQIFEKGKINV